MDLSDYSNSFELYGVQFEKYLHNDKLHNGDYGYVPMDCILTNTILKNDFETFFMSVEDGDELNLFDIVQMPNYDIEEETLIRSNISAVELAQFIKEKIKEKFVLYIPKRIEFNPNELIEPVC